VLARRIPRLFNAVVLGQLLFMISHRYWLVAATLFAMSLALPALAAPASLTGVWNATADVAGASIPFRLELQQQDGAVSGHFFDGPRATTPSTEGAFVDGHLHLEFSSYAATIDATVVNRTLEGVYVAPKHTVPIRAVLGALAPWSVPSGPAPAIAGEWIIPLASEKGEAAWRLIITQQDEQAEATILRVDGDTGTLDGGYRNGAFRLAHFAGERPGLLVITARPDHTLALTLSDYDGTRQLTAVRPAVAARQGVAPADPTRHTTVQNRVEPFRFAFPDLSGRLISNSDARFHHKVVVVDVMGSWCPNCHDEAPYLQALYARHHQQGLEVVALDFEQTPAQMADPGRLKAFIQRYGLTYTVLLAGETKEVSAKLPQAVGLNAWPTTFFLGRDGRVRATHVGFTSPGSGPRDVETRREVEHTVETLLAEK